MPILQVIIGTHWRLTSRSFGGWRTVVDDVPRLWHEAAGLSGKCVVACTRRPECVAVEIRSEAKLQLQVMRR